MRTSTLNPFFHISDNNKLGSRLQFFRQFMIVKGIGVDDVAAACGCSPLTVKRWFTPQYDDAPLSAIMQTISASGYELSIVMVRKGEKEANKELNWRRRAKAKFKADRLLFLTQAMLSYDITSKMLAELLGLHVTTVDYMFRANDVMVSRVYRIAEVLKMNLFITVAPVEEITDTNTVNIVMKSTGPISDFIKQADKEKDEEKGKKKAKKQ